MRAVWRAGRTCTALLCLALVLAAPRPTLADVTDASAAGFSVSITTDVNAAASAVYRALVERVGLWWDPAHTWSGNATNLSIDQRPGGCFCERLPNGGVQHMMITYTDAPNQLRMQGGLGPLASLGVAGSMTWTIAESSGRSRLELVYQVGGYAPGGLAALAPLVDGVLTTQVHRLKTFVETGRAK